MEQTIADERRSSRNSFLRRLGTFAAVGLGVALMPASAKAQSGRGCKDSSCPSCPPGSVPYTCDGCGNNCCKCLPDLGTCFNSTCPCG